MQDEVSPLFQWLRVGYREVYHPIYRKQSFLSVQFSMSINTKGFYSYLYIDYSGYKFQFAQ